MNNSRFKLKEVIIIVLVTSILVSFSTSLIISKRIKNSSRVNNDENISNFVEAYDTLKSKYYKNIDEKEFMDNIIKYMYESLDDPYTTYLTKDETEQLMETLQGEYKGIGVRIQTTFEKEKSIKTIFEVFKDSPAEKAGLLVGDVFKKVNDVDVDTLSTEDMIATIKASGSKNINVVVNRDNEEKTFVLNLAEVQIPSIYSEIYTSGDKKIGYIRVETFAVNTAGQFEENLLNLENENINSLIVDVRSNTGGFLTSVTDILQLFLEKNKTLYSIESKEGVEVVNDKTDTKRDYKIAILINELSASASEVLAGGLKDSYGAVTIGKTSYGKGKVQQTTTLKDGSTLKYTIADWKRPNGECIDQVGIIPDVEAEYSQDKDFQIEAAINELIK